ERRGGEQAEPVAERGQPEHGPQPPERPDPHDRLQLGEPGQVDLRSLRRTGLWRPCAGRPAVGAGGTPCDRDTSARWPPVGPTLTTSRITCGPPHRCLSAHFDDSHPITRTSFVFAVRAATVLVCRSAFTPRRAPPSAPATTRRPPTSTRRSRSWTGPRST